MNVFRSGVPRVLLTRYLHVNPKKPAVEVIRLAAQVLQRGGLVAFPTETVYGLGASALNASAVQKIFAAKGRPADNPLIIHVARKGEVELLARVPVIADRLMDYFWPGPLTLVLPARPVVPPEVTGGLDTVAVRQPAHPVALALLRAARLPVAAPSANRSGRPSPTTGRHVLQDLHGIVDIILEAGPCAVGVESTVLDLTGEVPAILRPGGISREQLDAVLGGVVVDAGMLGPAEAPRSPGQKYRHYAPRGVMYLVEGEPPELAGRLGELVRQARRQGRKVALLISEETAGFYAGREPEPSIMEILGSRQDLSQVASSLYAALLACDSRGADVIYAETFPEEGLGLAIMNRLLKAAGYRIQRSEAGGQRPE